MSCCKVSWCNNETEFYNKTQQRSYCSIHYNYKKYASNAAGRPWLMYKVEKILDNQLQCEGCGYDAQTFFPNRPINELAGLFDVDHIISDIKHTPEGEQPSNYQLLCKHCHILKSHEEGDFKAKKYR